MRKKDFDCDMKALLALQPEDFQKASVEEKANVRISNPSVRTLYKHLQATNARIMGTDQSQAMTCSKIWSTTVRYGPPTLWITINPSDLHDPIAQIFAGEDIDMDVVNDMCQVSVAKRAENIAKDPYAGAKFFHFNINLIIQSLFGIDSSRQQITSSNGIFGEVVSYIGVIESQNCGTLHLHMILWLKDTPPADEMHHLLKMESFHECIQTFISQNIHAHVPGMTSYTLKTMKHEADLP